MKIPRSISHPTLFVLLSGLLMYGLWLKTPSAAGPDSTSAQKQSQDLNVILNKHRILTQNNMHQIVDLLPGGYLVIHNLKKKMKINHEKFHKMSVKKAALIKEFFIGKFIKVADASQKTEIDLPLELYAPFCFSNNPKYKAMTNQCPIILRP